MRFRVYYFLLCISFFNLKLSVVSGQARWYRGNTHAHTTNSDGTLSPIQLAEAYRQAGYNFLFITDHDKLTQAESLSTTNFLCMPGEEITFVRHISALNIKKSILSSSVDPAIDSIKKQGGFAILNHPYWPPNVNCDEILGFNKLNLFEINNGLTEELGYHDNQTLWDCILTRGKLIYGIASDDAHSKESIGKSWIIVLSSILQKDSIQQAILNGKFYSSTGIRIKAISVVDSIMKVITENADEIQFITQNGKILKTDYSLTGQYRLTGTERYIRIFAKNKQNEKAWTQPVLWNGKYENGFLFNENLLAYDTQNINDSKRDLKFDVFPNPTSGVFVIKAQNPIDIMSFEIINAQGIILLSGELINHQSILNISSFVKGMYILRIYDSKSVVVHKLLLI